jgi:hypothetical protein
MGLKSTRQWGKAMGVGHHLERESAFGPSLPSWLGMKGGNVLFLLLLLPSVPQMNRLPFLRDRLPTSVSLPQLRSSSLLLHPDCHSGDPPPPSPPVRHTNIPMALLRDRLPTERIQAALGRPRPPSVSRRDGAG